MSPVVKELLYVVGRYLPRLMLLLLVVGAIITRGDQKHLRDHPAMLAACGSVLVLFGLHMTIFRERLAEDEPTEKKRSMEVRRCILLGVISSISGLVLIATALTRAIS